MRVHFCNLKECLCRYSKCDSYIQDFKEGKLQTQPGCSADETLEVNKMLRPYVIVHGFKKLFSRVSKNMCFLEFLGNVSVFLKFLVSLFPCVSNIVSRRF